MYGVPDREPDLTVVALGEAKTKGSTRSFVPRLGDGSLVMKNGKPVVVTRNDAGEPADAWAGIIATATRQAMVETGFQTVPRKVPVVIELVFYRTRNASDYGSGRNAGMLKGAAPALPAVRADVDKTCRLALDSLKGVAWHDDGQVTGMLAWKDFGTPARLEMRLWRLPATVGELAPVDVEQSITQNALFAG